MKCHKDHVDREEACITMCNGKWPTFDNTGKSRTVIGKMFLRDVKCFVLFCFSKYGPDLSQGTLGARANRWWTEAVGVIPEQENHPKRTQNKERVSKVRE